MQNLYFEITSRFCNSLRPTMDNFEKSRMFDHALVTSLAKAIKASFKPAAEETSIYNLLAT